MSVLIFENDLWLIHYNHALFFEFRVRCWNQCSPSKDQPGGCFTVGYLGVFEVMIKKISTFSNDLDDEAVYPQQVWWCSRWGGVAGTLRLCLCQRDLSRLEGCADRNLVCSLSIFFPLLTFSRIRRGKKIMPSPSASNLFSRKQWIRLLLYSKYQFRALKANCVFHILFSFLYLLVLPVF